MLLYFLSQTVQQHLHFHFWGIMPPPHQCGVAWSKYHNEPWLLLPWRRNQSEAQIGAVVVFRTHHHCGREAKHDTAVSTRSLRRRNGTYELILLSCGLGFYFLCILLVLFCFFFPLYLQVTLSQTCRRTRGSAVGGFKVKLVTELWVMWLCLREIWDFWERRGTLT